MRYIYFIIISLIAIAAYGDQKIAVVDFDQSMGVSNLPQFNLMLRSVEGEELYKYYKKLYQTNSPDKMPDSSTVIIPKIIHQLWVGSKPMPKLYLDYAKSCRNLHPDWQYKLWTEKDVQKYYPYSKDVLDHFSELKFYAALKDIYMYHILNEYGGVFLDLDYVCIKNMDELVYKYDFFAGLEPPAEWGKFPVPSASLIGSKSNNAILTETLKYIPKKLKKCYRRDGKILFNFRFRMINIFNSMFGKEEIYKCHDAVPHTMSLVFEKHRELCGDKNCKSVIFPATYFNPVYKDQSSNYLLMDKIKILLGTEFGKNYFTQIRPETIASQDWFD